MRLDVSPVTGSPELNLRRPQAAGTSVWPLAGCRLKPGAPSDFVVVVVVVFSFSRNRWWICTFHNPRPREKPSDPLLPLTCFMNASSIGQVLQGCCYWSRATHNLMANAEIIWHLAVKIALRCKNDWRTGNRGAEDVGQAKKSKKSETLSECLRAHCEKWNSKRWIDVTSGRWNDSDGL